MRAWEWCTAGSLCLALAGCGRPPLPGGLSDRDWWALSEHLSEPLKEYAAEDGTAPE